MKQFLLKDIKSICRAVKKKKFTSGLSKIKTVVIFDLVGSAKSKVEDGHFVGTQSALKHNYLCAKVTNRFGGEVIKELGDGILSLFDSPQNACLAALNVKYASQELLKTFSTKAAIVTGNVEGLSGVNKGDYLGDAIDKCSRVNANALPNQILIDGASKVQIQSVIKDYDNVLFSIPAKVNFKGIGAIEVFEISTLEMQFANSNTRFAESISPVRCDRFPDGTAFEELCCDTCHRPIDNYFLGAVSWDVPAGTKQIRKFYLSHKDKCDKHRISVWDELFEFRNPETYLNFIFKLVDAWRDGYTLKDTTSLKRLLLEHYRYVFRKSTAEERSDAKSTLG